MTDDKPYVILAAVDYSAAGDLALERALTLATEKRSAMVHVVNVLPVYQAGATVGDEGAAGAFAGSLPSVNEASEHLRAYTQRQVDAFRRERGDLSLSFLDQIVAHQRVDVPSEEIARLASEIEADIVVIGTHGRRGLSRLLLGSVAEGVVRLAPCAVLVVRPKAVPEPQPQIEPTCPRCLDARRETAGKELWCEQHREHHGPRHVYHQGDRTSEATNMPLLVRS
jgi:nucleotide-binding universal stress UspA family protein